MDGRGAETPRSPLTSIGLKMDRTEPNQTGPGQVETLNHLFFLCPYAKSLWNRLLRRPLLLQMLTSDYAAELADRWSRARNLLSGQFKDHFDLLFTASCWELWNERNKRLFEDQLKQPTFRSQNILCTVRSWKAALGDTDSI
ncbi:hypothetical protein ACMD2_23501 [Ananas comosus]|uniref:Reverse transcriptase zinc-binding domain-containing protein n=1 Tax=Ananas comosus TaxID=4615 RepID=A0A199VGI0_ANACO|nr:hypothetical protein ACMD2_23501 [Ananas comosus]